MNLLYETREEEIITKNKNPTTRTARFLKPTARNTNQICEIPKSPLVSDIFCLQNLHKWPLHVQFTGWNKPQEDWVQWFDRLVINHATTWIKAGIIDGILASLHEIPCNKDLVLGVSEFWCSETNSFIFPWGEATITLEDVMILGGFPVIGDPVNKPIKEDWEKIEIELRRVRRELADENCWNEGKRETTHLAWLKHFMNEEEEGEIENEEGEFEHVAFLSLWLSRFVLPDLYEGIISNYVFPIAIHLSDGIPIALAPSVLANLYLELTLLTQNAIELPLDSRYYASGLFKIVQLWVCERFPVIGANFAKPLRVGDPRVVRWDNVNFMVTLSFVRSRLKLGENFQWRPYASDLENWEQFPFYDESEQIISNCAVLDDCLLSFGRFLCPSEIVGHQTNCKQKYQPHRVAMQFGYDQDLPGEFRDSAADWDKGGFYIPSRTFHSGVSQSYYKWWTDSMLRREEAVDDFFRRKRNTHVSEGLVERQESPKCRPGSKEKSSDPRLMVETDASNDLDNVPLALRVCSNVVFKKARSHRTIRGQSSAALKPPRMKNKGSCDSNGGKAVSTAVKHLPSDSVDIDHVPLAWRLQSIAQTKATLKLLESYASMGNVGNLLQGRSQTEGLTSPTSDADSHITRKDSSPGKTTMEADRDVENNVSGMSCQELLARLEKLERDIAALGQTELGNAEFSTVIRG